MRYKRGEVSMTKKIIGLLIAVAAVVLLSVASAGCIGDQICGTYVHVYNDGDEAIKFNADGTYVRVGYDIRGNLEYKYQGTWERIEDNLYTIGDEETLAGFWLGEIQSREQVEWYNGYIARYKYGSMAINYMRA